MQTVHPREAQERPAEVVDWLRALVSDPRCPYLVFTLRVGDDGQLLQEHYNATALAALARSAGEIEGKSPSQSMPAAAAAEIVRHCRRCLLEGRPLEVESELDFGRGPRIFDLFLVPLRGGRTEVTQIAAIARDLTDERQAQRALFDSESKFEATFEAMPYAISVSDLSTGRYLSCNAAFERASGYTKAEAVGRTSLELNLWVDPAARSKWAALMTREGRVRDFETQFRAKDGRIIDALCNCDRIELDGVACVVNTMEDVTDKRRAEEEIRDLQEMWQTAFRASPDAISVVEFGTQRYLEINAAFEETYGYQREHVLGKSVDEVAIFVQPEAGEALAQQLLKLRRVRDVEIEAKRRDGGRIFVLVSVELLSIGGRLCTLQVSRDVTERRRIESERAKLEQQLRQSQRLEALGTLSGGIAHDFNNILMAALNFTELALVEDDISEVRSSLVEVRRACQRAAALVRQILTFSRRQKQERRPLELGALVREALKLLTSTVPKMIEFELEVAKDVPIVLGDATQIHQVIMNLCANAAHAIGTQPGKISLSLTRASAQEVLGTDSELERSYARISVRDTGSGMLPETMQHVFDPFFTTKPLGQGTGLGLSVVHGIVAEHQGVIRVESQLGVGSHFIVYLPEHLAEAVNDAPAREREIWGNGQRVLLIDDEVQLGTAAALGLQKLGFDVTCCADPQLALQKFQASPKAYDIVVTDFAMPGMTGLDVARAILVYDAELPVLLMSGHSDDWTAEKVKALGLRGLIDKPVSLQALAHAIAGELELSKRGPG